jgi:hypothetical protein
VYSKQGFLLFIHFLKVHFMKNLGAGIAVAGIWIGVGISSLTPVAGASIASVAGAATVATICVAFFL